MKKLLICLLAVIGFIATANAQTVVVQNNQGGATEQTQDPNMFYINGIPSTQDIGGVEAKVERRNRNDYAVFTNYQSFTVTVLYQVLFGSFKDPAKFSGSFVLTSGETKSILVTSDFIYEIATITRKL